MTDQDRPEAISDDDLDAAQGGLTQNDLDNGRLICEVGIAPAKPGKSVVLLFDEADAVKQPASDWAVFEPNGEG